MEPNVQSHPTFYSNMSKNRNQNHPTTARVKSNISPVRFFTMLDRLETKFPSCGNDGKRSRSATSTIVKRFNTDNDAPRMPDGSHQLNIPSGYLDDNVAHLLTSVTSGDDARAGADIVRRTLLFEVALRNHTANDWCSENNSSEFQKTY